MFLTCCVLLAGSLFSQEIQKKKSKRVKFGHNMKCPSHEIIFEYKGYTYIAAQGSNPSGGRTTFSILKLDSNLKSVESHVADLKRLERYSYPGFRFNPTTGLLECWYLHEEKSIIHLYRWDLNVEKLRFEKTPKLVTSFTLKLEQYFWGNMDAFISPSGEYMMIKFDYAFLGHEIKGNSWQQHLLLFNRENEMLYHVRTEAEDFFDKKYQISVDDKGRTIAYKEDVGNFKIRILHANGEEDECHFKPEKHLYALQYKGIYSNPKELLSYKFQQKDDYLYFAAFTECDEAVRPSGKVEEVKFSNGIYIAQLDLNDTCRMLRSMTKRFKRKESEELVRTIYSVQPQTMGQRTQEFASAEKCNKGDFLKLYLDQFFIDDLDRFYLIGSSYIHTLKNIYVDDQTTDLDFIYDKRATLMYCVDFEKEDLVTPGMFVKESFGSGFDEQPTWGLKEGKPYLCCYNQHQLVMKPGRLEPNETIEHRVIQSKMGHFKVSTSGKMYYVKTAHPRVFKVMRLDVAQ
jgi:hypothetical protein